MRACFLTVPTYGINTYTASGDNNCSKDAQHLLHTKHEACTHTLHYAHHMKYTFCGSWHPKKNEVNAWHFWCVIVSFAHNSPPICCSLCVCVRVFNEHTFPLPRSNYIFRSRPVSRPQVTSKQYVKVYIVIIIACKRVFFSAAAAVCVMSCAMALCSVNDLPVGA